MPRYYFDIRKGDYFSADEGGVELPSLQAAQQKAAYALAEMAREAVNIALFWSSIGTVAA